MALRRTFRESVSGRNLALDEPSTNRTVAMGTLGSSPKLLRRFYRLDGGGGKLPVVGAGTSTQWKINGQARCGAFRRGR